ncbi:MAG: hypothetical protein WAM71_08825 [Candidatus Korobacteraceae bacterium]
MGSTNSFDEFVQHQQQQNAAVNWTKERDEWLRNLQRLYEEVEAFLAEYVKKNEIRLTYRPVSLHEEYIGSYEARQMLIGVGRSEILLNPVGTFIIGAWGRVDIVGPYGTAQLLLVDKSATTTRSLIRVEVKFGEHAQVPTSCSKPIELAWKLITAPPARQLLELSKETFYSVVIGVVNG